MSTIHILRRFRLFVITGLVGAVVGSGEWAVGQDRGGDRRGGNRGGERGDRGGREDRGGDRRGGDRRGGDERRGRRGEADRGERRGGDQRDRNRGGGGSDDDRRAQWMRSLDQNGDGNLELSEIPERMRGMFENRAKELGFDLARPIPIDRYLTERTGEGKHPTAFEEELQPSLAAGFDTPLSPEEEAMLRPERRREILLKNATPEVIGKGGSGAKKEGEKGQSKEDSQRDQQAAKAIIERYDSDKNGTIDGDEANSLPPFFRGYDANGDGKFTGEEFQTGLARMRSGGRGGGFGGGGFGGGGFGGRGGGGEDEQGEGDRRRGGRRGGFGGGGFGGPGGPGGPGGRGFDRGGDGERRPGRGGDESDEREGDQAEREGDEAESASRKSYRFTPAQERIPEGARSFILPKDKDGDGQVSMAEFATSWSDSKLQEFDSYDADGDGYITGAECLKKGAPSFRERRAARARGE